MYTYRQRTVLFCNLVAFFCQVTCTTGPTKPLLKHRRLMTSTGLSAYSPPLHDLNLPSIFTPSPIPIFHTLSWVQLISPSLWPPSQLHFQSYYQISPAICVLSSSPHAAKNSWENWITMLIDSATILWFPMSANPELLGRRVSHSYLAGLALPHSSCSQHTILGCPPTSSPPSLFTLDPPPIENLQVISCDPYPVPPLCLCICLDLWSFTLHCTSWENLECFVPENLVALCFTFAKTEHHYIFLPYAIISPGNNTNESL